MKGGWSLTAEGDWEPCYVCGKQDKLRLKLTGDDGGVIEDHPCCLGCGVEKLNESPIKTT